MGVAIFGGEVGVEHGGVVGGKSDRNAVAKELRKRMGFDGCVRLRELAREGSGQNVAAGAEFERDAAVGEEIHEGGIVDGGDTVADALDVEKLNGFADFFGAADFSGVHEQMKPT